MPSVQQALKPAKQEQQFCLHLAPLQVEKSVKLLYDSR